MSNGIGLTKFSTHVFVEESKNELGIAFSGGVSPALLRRLVVKLTFENDQDIEVHFPKGESCKRIPWNGQDVVMFSVSIDKSAP